jgi:chromosome segregation ATPase
MVTKGNTKSALNMNSIEEITWKAKKFDELEGELASLREEIASLRKEISSLLARSERAATVLTELPVEA